jgi:hypothetical protein
LLFSRLEVRLSSEAGRLGAPFLVKMVSRKTRLAKSERRDQHKERQEKGREHVLVERVVLDRVVELRYSRGVELLETDIAPIAKESLPSLCVSISSQRRRPERSKKRGGRTAEEVRVLAATPPRLNLLDFERVPVLVHRRSKTLHQLDGLLDDLWAGRKSAGGYKGGSVDETHLKRLLLVRPSKLRSDVKSRTAERLELLLHLLHLL